MTNEIVAKENEQAIGILAEKQEQLDELQVKLDSANEAIELAQETRKKELAPQGLNASA